MVRPRKQDRESIALTTIRVSPKVRQLLHDLKLKHDFATTDQVLRYYLPSNVAENRPIFHSARELRDLTQPNIDKMITGAASEVMKKINNVNKYGPRQSRLKSKSKPK